MISHAPRKRSGNAAVVQVELSVANKRLRCVDGSLSGSLFTGPLLDVFDGARFRLLQGLRAPTLAKQDRTLLGHFRAVP